MTSDVKERKKHWKGKCDKKKGKFKWTRIANGLTYDEATEREKSEREKCGTHCRGASGGKEKKGRVYTVYRVDCT